MPTQNLHGCTLLFTLTQQEFSTELFPHANTLMLILNQTMPPLCSGFSPPSPLQFLKGIFILYLFHSIHLYGTSLSSDLNLTMLIVNSQLSRLNSSSVSRISLLPWAPHLPRHQVSPDETCCRTCIYCCIYWQNIEFRICGTQPDPIYCYHKHIDGENQSMKGCPSCVTQRKQICNCDLLLEFNSQRGRILTSVSIQSTSL